MSEEHEIDYGPLTRLIGTWKGEKGMDIAPEPDGSESNPYYETIVFSAIGDVSNAETQVLAVLHYRQIVQRKSNDEVFHDETGYWMWDASSRTVMHSLTIPRAVCVLAGGEYNVEDEQEEIILDVVAGIDDPNWSIVQSPFMQKNARTTAFHHRMRIEPQKLHYRETTIIDIYGNTFEHTDENTLYRQ